MQKLCLLGTFLAFSPELWASSSTSKTEIVEESEKTEVKIFCSKTSEKDAVQMCTRWLEQQSKTLGQRLLTSYCSQGELNTGNAACLYQANGELKYVLKKYRTETTKGP